VDIATFTEDEMITIDRDTCIALMYACERLLDGSSDYDINSIDEESARMVLENRAAVMKAHDTLQMAFCGVHSICGRLDN